MSCSSCQKARQALKKGNVKQAARHTAHALHQNYFKPLENTIAKARGTYIRKK